MPFDLPPHLPPSDEGGGAPLGAPEGENTLNENPYFPTQVIISNSVIPSASEESPYALLASPVPRGVGQAPLSRPCTRFFARPYGLPLNDRAFALLSALTLARFRVGPSPSVR